MSARTADGHFLSPAIGCFRRPSAREPSPSVGRPAHAPGLLRACWLGRVSFSHAHAIQLRLHSAVASGSPDTVLLLEHDPVVTVGRAFEADQLPRLRSVLPPQMQIAHVERGGHLTYHGPGQLVVYPIVHLRCVGHDLHRWLDLLEDAAAATVTHFGLRACAGRSRARGVWAAGRKIASVGVAVRRWVSFHGVAINVKACWRPPLPLPLCQMPLDRYSSLQELGADVELLEVATVFAHEFSRLAGFSGLSWHEHDKLA